MPKVYNRRHDCVGKVVHWELYKKFKFDHVNKWHMYNPEIVRGFKTHKILWGFKMQMDHQISTRRPDPVIVNKKQRTCPIVHFAVREDHRVKLKEVEKTDKYLDLVENWKNYGTWRWLWYQL